MSKGKLFNEFDDHFKLDSMLVDRIREYTQYFSGTMIKFNRGGEDGIFLVEGVNQMRGKEGLPSPVFFYGTSSIDGVKRLKINPKTYKVALSYPGLGLRNIDGAFYPILLRRSTAKQWKKGFRFSSVNSTFIGVEASLDRIHSEPHSWTMNACDSRNVKSNLIKSVFYPQYPCFDEAVELINSGVKVCVALNKNIAIGATLLSNHPMIYRDNKMVGFVSDRYIHLGKGAIKVREELEELIKLEVKIL